MSDPAVGKCWQNGSIFQSIKVILEVSLSPPSGPPVIDLSYAQDNFATILGYPLNSLPIPLETLFSRSNAELDIAGLIHAIYRCTSHDSFILLRDAHGVDLACHMHLSLGNKVDHRFSKSSADASGLKRDHVSVLTIRSASSIGNVRAINLLVNPTVVDATHADYNAVTHSRLVENVTRQIDANTECARASATMKTVPKEAGAHANVKSSHTDTTKQASSSMNSCAEEPDSMVMRAPTIRANLAQSDRADSLSPLDPSDEPRSGEKSSPAKQLSDTQDDYANMESTSMGRIAQCGADLPVLEGDECDECVEGEDACEGKKERKRSRENGDDSDADLS